MTYTGNGTSTKETSLKSTGTAPGAPLVSVVLTSYNYEAYVAEAIQSVFTQSYRNIELIVVDDGSQDASPDVIRSMIQDAPFPVKTLFKENGGQSSAFNAAYEHVHGEIVCFIDSDDVWREDKVKAMVNLIRRCPDGGVYQHQCEVGFGGPNRLEYIISGDVFDGWKRLGPRVNVAVYQGRISPFVPTVGLAFRKAVLDQVMPIPKQLITCPDAFLTRTCITHGPLYSRPAVLATWRDHGDNAGKDEQFGYQAYWLKVIMPALNEYYRDHDIPLEFYYDPADQSKPAKAAIPGGLRRLPRRLLNRLRYTLPR